MFILEFSMKLRGYKTYIVVAATICYALGGLVIGKVDVAIAIEIILVALGIGGLRNSIPQIPVQPQTPQ